MSEQVKQQYIKSIADPLGQGPTVRAKDYIDGMRMLEAAERDYIRVASGTPKIMGAAYANGAMTTDIGFVKQSEPSLAWRYLQMMQDEMLKRAMFDTPKYVIPEDMVPYWLRESKPVSKAEPAKPIGPRKPTPALPAEVHAQTAFDSDRAHEALMALCRG